MARYIFILLVVHLHLTAFSQKLSGAELLDKAIAHHDPNDNWKTFKGTFTVVMTTPNSNERKTKIVLDFPGQFYSSTVTKDGNTIVSTLKKDSCSLMLNGNSKISKTAQDSLRISCDRAKMMRDYYTYLYGLPMKLRDPGTNIHETVEMKTFKNKEYLVLKVHYDETVGKDTWYFYFDPKTYAMEVYQFYKNESQKDGEYIVLSDTMEVNDIKMPKTRAWYYNKDDGFLGTDTLTEAMELD